MPIASQAGELLHLENKIPAQIVGSQALMIIISAELILPPCLTPKLNSDKSPVYIARKNNVGDIHM